jgi:hypothetical protein
MKSNKITNRAVFMHGTIISDYPATDTTDRIYEVLYNGLLYRVSITCNGNGSIVDARILAEGKVYITAISRNMKHIHYLVEGASYWSLNPTDLTPTMHRVEKFQPVNDIRTNSINFVDLESCEAYIKKLWR